jgi:hypothetical protein
MDYSHKDNPIIVFKLTTLLLVCFVQIWICQVEDYKIVLSFKTNRPWSKEL